MFDCSDKWYVRYNNNKCLFILKKFKATCFNIYQINEWKREREIFNYKYLKVIHEISLWHIQLKAILVIVDDWSWIYWNGISYDQKLSNHGSNCYLI